MEEKLIKDKIESLTKKIIEKKEQIEKELISLDSMCNEVLLLNKKLDEWQKQQTE